MKNPYTDAVDQILRWTVEYRTFFKKNPKPLAYLMGFHDEIHYGSRHDENEELHDWENPKYAIVDLEEEVGGAYASLIYDAWAYGSHCQENDQHGEPLKAEGKLNKTMDEWVEICLNPNYRYHSLYPNRVRVLDYYLCTIGTGLDWNKDGFLTHTGPSGVDLDIFFGAENSFDDLPDPIKQTVTAYRNDPTISQGMLKRKKVHQEWQAEQEALRDFARNGLPKYITECGDPELKKIMMESWENHSKDWEKAKAERLAQPYEFYPMSKEHSMLCRMPSNAHDSYIQAGIELCHLILAGKETQSYGGKEYPSDNHKLANQFLKKWGYRENVEGNAPSH